MLDGDLVLVGGGDLAFGGRRIDADTIEYTNFDHNDANGLGTAILTPQDPLFALNDLARQVRAAGITSVSGDVVVDSRLFEPYRVPNGNLLITPTMVNENMVDVTVTPAATAGQPATCRYRPQTAAFAVGGIGRPSPKDRRTQGRAVRRLRARRASARRMHRHGVGHDPRRLQGAADRKRLVRRHVPGRGSRTPLPAPRSSRRWLAMASP